MRTARQWALALIAAIFPVLAGGDARARCAGDGCLKDAPELALVFEAFGVAGTFVLHEAGADTTIVHDAARAALRVAPQSTFKIVNTLIALETGAVRDENEVIPYGGKKQPFPQWERDMPMREAFPASAVPIYQEIARRIGPERMRSWLARLSYGSGEIGTAVDRFWLDGPLAISAIEQTEFLARLALGRLGGVSARSLDILRRIAIVEEKDGAKLYGKTGLQFGASPNVGWWVGWVERGGRIHAFALSIDIVKPGDVKTRVELGKALLAKLEVW